MNTGRAYEAHIEALGDEYQWSDEERIEYERHLDEQAAQRLNSNV